MVNVRQNHVTTSSPRLANMAWTFDRANNMHLVNLSSACLYTCPYHLSLLLLTCDSTEAVKPGLVLAANHECDSFKSEVQLCRVSLTTDTDEHCNADKVCEISLKMMAS